MINSRRGLTRRFFLQGCSGIGTMGLGSTFASLSLMNAAQAACQPDNGSDYKALVCVFLLGGNDSHNLFVPTDPRAHAGYANARGNLALNLAQLNAHSFSSPGYDDGFNGNQFGMHPSLDDEYTGAAVSANGGLLQLYNEGKLALLANVGSLVEPIANASAFPVSAQPPQLYAHNAQQFQWQTGWADTVQKSGWGGRVADLMACLNGTSSFTTSIALAGFNTFQVGDLIAQYALQTNGLPAGLEGPYRARQAAAGLLGNSTNWLAMGYDDIKSRALASFEALSTVLGEAPEPPLSERYPASFLGQQLKAVAKMISVRDQLDTPLRRQIYMCAAGGFDTHAGQNEYHPLLLSDVSQAITAFTRSLEALGVSQEVTLFSASDFGRTFTSNGKGSDHAWGGNQFIVGGAVDGGKIFGQLPELTLASSLNVDSQRGHFIPTTSVEQYGAVLANWFGVPIDMLPEVFPNYGNFDSPLNNPSLDFLG